MYDNDEMLMYLMDDDLFPIECEAQESEEESDRWHGRCTSRTLCGQVR